MSLEDTLSNMTLYDAKKYFRKAQNVVFNYTDMEAKVREATNNEPWGASSTLMEQIAQGTYNPREREEILSMILRRFTEKSGNLWRQIYKALQLLEYLITHGAERFIDEARSSLGLIRMLESFHYVDSEGRDQGANVRSRAQAMTSLLSSDDAIRSARRKARSTAGKFRGTGNAMGATGESGYNTHAGFARSNGISVSADFDPDSDDDTPEWSKPAKSQPSTSKKQTTTANTAPSSGHKPEDADDDDDEDFADFQSAQPITTSIAASNTTNTMDLLSGMNNNSTVNNSSNMNMDMNTSLMNSNTNTNNTLGMTINNNNSGYLNSSSPVPAIATKTEKSDPFGSLFSSAKLNTKSTSPAASATQAMSTLKTNSTIVKSNTTSTQTNANDNDDDDDDLFGDFKASTNAAAVPSSNNSNDANQEVDLLDF
ncbi:hypothetical protein TBLA_0E04760 [Henningerozyma blattae CBS 6284]|uniref:ENTH domain-containing protein n=1 Tax=Henningerozyma blattae (strain ATCC 34711 / CBS 6284 / DSM 70876 / NBRC 10599 / NRRL Y-10934 / UCD 77-7) TaxID=1071380 RepID=I2H576_HENB6|nr:hypothetical protein TBLA_0E04760 [Tetrapisispora blattae CBS 6284]CCH61528.1 hypothetical protein TBLA_0E04760 [Tetrapisispora blattae CBS 6284]